LSSVAETVAVPPVVPVKLLLAMNPLITAELGDTLAPGGPLTKAKLTVRPFSTVGATDAPLSSC
jgi:hypothetical protein